MYIIPGLILAFSVGTSIGSSCNDLSGFWQNQLGSNMTIILGPDNQITGEYSTAVESKKGASLVSSNITGLYETLDNAALLSFTVLFNRGKSLATWVGQCMVCDGKEILFTTWVLRSYHPKSVDRWMSNHINQDTFKRVKNGGNHIPRHLKTAGPSEEDKRSSFCENSIKAGKDGHWILDSGDVLKFDSCLKSGLFSGVRQTIPLFGRSDGGQDFTALGFVSSSGKEIKGWAGHMYEKISEKERKIDASWLVHSYVDNCKQPSDLVRSGKGSYTFALNKKDENEQSVSLGTKISNFFWSLFGK